MYNCIFENLTHSKFLISNYYGFQLALHLFLLIEQNKEVFHMDVIKTEKF